MSAKMKSVLLCFLLFFCNKAIYISNEDDFGEIERKKAIYNLQLGICHFHANQYFHFFFRFCFNVTYSFNQLYNFKKQYVSHVKCLFQYCIYWLVSRIKKYLCSIQYIIISEIVCQKDQKMFTDKRHLFKLHTDKCNDWE